MMMRAGLKAMESTDAEEFQQVAQEVSQKWSNILKIAKQLAKQL